MDAAALLRQFGTLPRTRVIAVAAFFVVVASVVALGVVSHPARTKLFAASLFPEQLTEVEERLAEWNTPFTPVSDNVLVEAARRNELLLKLSLAGVPHAHVAGSQEILAKVAAFTPQAVIDEQTRTGLADDIALALRGIAGVRDASVSIAPARAGAFADESSSDASASVRLQLDGDPLSADVTAGVRAFVAASVPGLRPERVTILDDRGSSTQLANADESATLQSSLQSALDTMLGAGASIVRVHVDVDRRSISSHDVRRSPLGVMPIASTTQDERYAGEGKQYGKSSQQLDRGSDTRESTANTDGPRTSRISAAVIVDAARGADLAQIRELSVATLGIDPHRGDTVDVQAIPFSRQVAPKKDPWWLLYGAIVPAVPAIITAAFGLALLRFGREPVREIARAFAQRVRVTRTSQAIDGAAPAQVRSALRDEPPHTAAAIISALPATTAAAVLDMYPAQERAAIVRRMQRPASPIVGDARELLADA